jgi:hypothetical protein
MPNESPRKNRGPLPPPLFAPPTHFLPSSSSSPVPLLLQTPDAQSSLLVQSSPAPLSLPAVGAVHLPSWHELLWHSSSSSQSAPLPLSVSAPPPSAFARQAAPAGPSGQSLMSAHCFGGGLLGRWSASPEIDVLMWTTYGLVLLPPPAMLSPSVLKTWM